MSGSQLSVENALQEMKGVDTRRQCCSQGQNPKAKDRTLKAKAWTLGAKTKARTLESKAN